MPYDVNGTYTLPSPEYPFIPNTLADANDVNTVLADIRTALSSAMLRSGVAPLTGQLKLADGTALLPGLTFSADGNTGLYRIGADSMGLAANGTLQVTVDSTGTTFATAPSYAADPGSANVLARKSYVDGVGSAATASANATASAAYPLKAGTGATGTWPISISGAAATLTLQGVAEAALNTATTTGVYNVVYSGYSRSMLVYNGGGSTGTVQMEADYQGSLRWRNKTDDTTWTAWRDVLQSNNYTNWAPSLTGGGASGSWGISVTGSSASCTGNAASATLATKASTLASSGGDGTPMTFYYSGQSGQPTWLWGGDSVSTMYVYNPANFNVNYANSAGSASTATSATSATTATSATYITGTSYNGYGTRTSGTGAPSGGSNGDIHYQYT